MKQRILDYVARSRGAFVLSKARIPAGLVANSTDFQSDAAGFVLADIAVDGDAFLGVSPPGTAPADALDLGGALVWPTFVDMHTHLDKSHLGRRVQNPDRTLLGAVGATRGDHANWTEEDLRGRATFALRCAYAHGTSAMRSHLDALGPQSGAVWRVMTELRREWAARIGLQFVAMAPIGFYLDDGAAAFAARAAEHGALLGGVTKLIGVPPERQAETLSRSLAALFDLAVAHDLDIDLHVDESLDPQADTLLAVAEATIRHGYEGRVTCGHCCSLSVMSDARKQAILEQCAEAGIGLVSLPLVNSWLQDRHASSTPLRRGVAPLQEAAALGIPVALASDNCGDPFHPFGDYDLLEVLRETTRTAHLEEVTPGWAAAVTTVPAARMGRDVTLRAGATADLVLFSARSMSELLSRPQSDRVVLRAGRPVNSELPPYSDLDRLFAIGQ